MSKDGDYLVARWQSIKSLKRWLNHSPAFSDLMFTLLVDGHLAQLREYGLSTYFEVNVSKN